MATDKLIMIIGANGGIGHSLGQRAATLGWIPILVSRNPKGVHGSKPDGETLAIEADVSTRDGARAALAGVIEVHGRPPDALVNCAGSTLLLPLHRTQENDYRQCLAANLDSAFFSLAAFVDACLAMGRPGAAVLISSVVAQIGVANHEAIAAAKAGVEGLIRSAAATYASKGIRVNGVAPGMTRTPATERLFVNEHAERQIVAQYPLGRYGNAEDIAAAIVWLLSPEASWVSGQILPVDGGFTSVRPVVRSVVRAAS